MKSHLKQDCLAPDDAEELGAAIAEMPEDLEITQEMYVAHAEEQGWPEPSEEELAELEELFDAIDADGNGAHSKDELEAAWAVYTEHCPPPPKGKGPGPKGKKLAQIKQKKILLKVKNSLKKKGGPGGPGEFDPSSMCPTEAEQEFLEAEFEKLPADLAVTKEDYVALAEEHGVELTEAEEEVAEAIFDEIDTNDDGAHSKDELEAAYTHFMGEYCS